MMTHVFVVSDCGSGRVDKHAYGNMRYLSRMKYGIVFCCCLLFFACEKPMPVIEPPPPPPEEPVTDTSKIMYRGADLSFLPEIEENNVSFYDQGIKLSALDIMQSYGCNLVRVRLWHTPANKHSGLQEVLDFCKRVHDKGMKLLLDFHYSDTWTDPANQQTPAAWLAADFTTLQDSLYNYSKQVISLLQQQNTLPDIVQVGNEINGGFLWNTGKIYTGTTQNWVDFSALLKKAVEGVKAADPNNSIKIMIHYAGIEGADYFYGNLFAQHVPYDMIGISYYPWWSTKDLALVQQSFNSLAATYQKDILVAETAYPFTLQWEDNTHNVVGLADQLITGYPASETGQFDFLTKLRNIIAAIPGNRGAGFCYWEPDWVAFSGGTVIEGSGFENLALFDFNNNALRGMEAFHE